MPGFQGLSVVFSLNPILSSSFEITKFQLFLPYPTLTEAKQKHELTVQNTTDPATPTPESVFLSPLLSRQDYKPSYTERQLQGIMA